MTISGNTIAHEALIDQNAIDWRRQFQRMLGYDFVAAAGVGSGGVARSGDCAVSQRGAGANMSVDVAVGFVAAGMNSGGTGYSAEGGVYTGYNDAVLNVVIAAADPVNPRIDRIGFGIRDAAFSGATNDGQITVITGTPAGVPAVPAVPATYIAWVDLAQVAVAALAASITNANVTDKRQRLSALGGITPCSSSTTYPTTPWDGMHVYDQALKQMMCYDLSLAAWKAVSRVDAFSTMSGQQVLIAETNPTGVTTTQLWNGASLAATFSDLTIIWNAWSSAAGDETLYLRLNNDTGAAAYRTDIIYEALGAAPVTYSAALSGIRIGPVSRTGANRLSAGQCRLLSATGVNGKLSAAMSAHHNVPGTATQTEHGHGQWETGAAITRIDCLLIGGNNFTAGSKFRLYGTRI